MLEQFDKDSINTRRYFNLETIKFAIQIGKQFVNTKMTKFTFSQKTFLVTAAIVLVSAVVIQSKWVEKRKVVRFNARCLREKCTRNTTSDCTMVSCRCNGPLRETCTVYENDECVNNSTTTTTTAPEETTTQEAETTTAELVPDNDWIFD